MFNMPLSSTLHYDEQLKTFLYGSRMDASMASYISAPLLLLFFVLAFVSIQASKKIIKIYTGIILFISCLIIATDIPVYKAWNFRLDATPLKYLNNPAEAIASVGNTPVWQYVIVFVLLFITFWFLFKSLIEKKFYPTDLKLATWPVKSILVLLAILSVIGFRGGLQLAPINQSSTGASTRAQRSNSRCSESLR